MTGVGEPALNASALAVLGGAALYGALNCLFTVEGGHRGIVFNRVVGIKEQVGPEAFVTCSAVGFRVASPGL